MWICDSFIKARIAVKRNEPGASSCAEPDDKSPPLIPY